MSHRFSEQGAKALFSAGLIVFLVACGAPSRGTVDSAEQFPYEDRTYELDGYNTLFASTSSPGKVRRKLFAEYLTMSPEGKARRVKASSDDPAVVWRTLAVEEKSTFVATTSAMYCVDVNAGQSRLIDWVLAIDEIHGDERFGGGRLLASEAFRLYARLTPTALGLVRTKSGTFLNNCNNKAYGYLGWGGTHGDYCLPKTHFDSEAKFDGGFGFRGIQFNFNKSRSDCADIDIDYSQGCHFTRGNSNVLDDCLLANHIERLKSEYGSGSGLRLVPGTTIAP